MDQQKVPLSVLILARNEEKHIKNAIESCGWASEVVVIDAESTDTTASIAKQLGAKVVTRPWTNFSDQRNFSLTQASNEWVLVLDADETVSESLAVWLRQFFDSGKNKIETKGYRIKRAEFFLGKRIYGACWNPSYQDRFFLVANAKYVGEIHEYPIVEAGFLFAPEEAVIVHTPTMTMESFLDKMNRYTSIEAFDRFETGQRTSLPHLGVVFFATWWKNFFYYRAYQDGAHGFVISLMEAVSRTVRHLKLWQLQNLEARGKLHTVSDPRKNRDFAPRRNLESRES